MAVETKWMSSNTTGEQQVPDRADDATQARALGGCRNAVAEADGEREVTEVVGRELQLGAAVVERQQRQHHHAGVADEDVERTFPAGDERVDRSRGRPGQASPRRPGRRRARSPPARLGRDRGPRASPRRRRPASARAVSTPIPEPPPVTIARLPPRSIPATTSAAVESKPYGVRIGECVSAFVMRAVSGSGGGLARPLIILGPAGRGSGVS